jgi:hypothetical protein
VRDVFSEATAGQRQREEYAPPEPERTADEAVDILSRAMRRRDAERLALEAIEPQRLPIAHAFPAPPVPLGELAEAGAEAASILPSPELPSHAAWSTPGRGQRSPERDHGVARDL